MRRNCKSTNIMVAFSSPKHSFSLTLFPNSQEEIDSHVRVSSLKSRFVDEPVIEEVPVSRQGNKDCSGIAEKDHIQGYDWGEPLYRNFSPNI